MNYIKYIDHKIFGATTMKDKSAPEQNNMALHVCIQPEEVMKTEKNFLSF